MSRRSRPSWVYAALSGLLGVLLLALWLGSSRTGEEATRPEHPAVKLAQIEQAKKAQADSRKKADKSTAGKAAQAQAGGEPQVVFEESGHESVAAGADEGDSLPVPEAHHGIALILDDVGYDLPALRRAIDLKVPMAIAILPDSPYAAKAAEIAHRAGYPVMLHMPMEPANPIYSKKMDDTFIRVGMSRDEVRGMMNRALMRVPYVVGVNNHMGSRLTTEEKPMRWVMEVCREQRLFFVDSRTNKDSVAARLAREAGLRWGQRRVFLDDSVKPELLAKSWKAAESRLQRHGSVIVIAHPHRETLDFLERKLTPADKAAMVPLLSLLKTTKQDVAGR